MFLSSMGVNGTGASAAPASSLLTKTTAKEALGSDEASGKDAGIDKKLLE